MSSAYIYCRIYIWACSWCSRSWCLHIYFCQLAAQFPFQFLFHSQFSLSVFTFQFSLLCALRHQFVLLIKLQIGLKKIYVIYLAIIFYRTARPTCRLNNEAKSGLTKLCLSCSSLLKSFATLIVGQQLNKLVYNQINTIKTNIQYVRV